MRNLGLIVGMALVTAACAGGTDQGVRISDITVETDLSAIQSRDAVTYWQSLSADLETALATEFAGRIDPAGNSLTVDIDELSLSETFTPGATVEDTRLSGVVTLVTPGDGREDQAFTVTASSSDVIPFLPADTDVVTISPTDAAYYQAVVQAFAQGTANAFSSGG